MVVLLLSLLSFHVRRLYHKEVKYLIQVVKPGLSNARAYVLSHQ